MEKDTGSTVWKHGGSDDLDFFDIEASLESSPDAQRAQYVDESSLEDLPPLSDTEDEKQTVSQQLESALHESVEKEQVPSLPGKKRGRKMVLVAVLQEAKSRPTHQSESKSAPTSPLPFSPSNNSVVSKDSLDYRREAFRTMSGCKARSRASAIWPRSYSDSYKPDCIPASPSQHQATVLFDNKCLWKRKKMLSNTANHRSLSWSSDEEKSSWITAHPKGAIRKPKNTRSVFIDHLLRTKESDGRFFHPVTKLESLQGKKVHEQPLPMKQNTAATHPSNGLKENTEQETVDDLHCQLAQALYGMKIAQIEGFSEIYRAIQFPSSILTHTSAFCKTFQFFRRQGVSSKLDIGYRYFVNQKEYLPEKGLLPGICTFNDPFAFYPPEHIGNVQGQLVARLPGNLHKSTTTVAHLKESEAATYTAVDMPLRRSFVQILSSPDQCLPLLHFDAHTILDLYDNESMGNLVLHTYHQRLQKELDQIFNDGVLTKVPFHLPSEHPDFQPI